LLAPLASAQTPAPSASTASSGDKVVTLSPYEVKADNDQNYNALNSNSITQFNTELNKLPLSADIMDQAFMKDVAGESVEEMIENYTAGSGFTDASGGSSAAAYGQPGDRATNGYLVSRGLKTAISRDGFFLNLNETGVNYSSTFDTERVELIDGPQAILYGGSGDGAVINQVSKQARLGQPAFGSALFRVDQYGSKMGMPPERCQVRSHCTIRRLGTPSWPSAARCLTTSIRPG